jgi:tungstate transport system substrate-binding protein
LLYINKKFLSLTLIIIIIGLSSALYFSSKNEAVLTLATTTSVDNSGLLEILINGFKGQNPDVEVLIHALGTGAALRMARDGGADAILVHSPIDELEFLNAGYGKDRTTLFYNYFLIVGPASDPLNLADEETIFDVFEKIAMFSSTVGVNFISRGDNSGTHIKELEIWKVLDYNVNSFGNWYIETGTGMSNTLVVADQSNSYTLTDLGTYLQLNGNEAIQLIRSYDKKDQVLYNPYSYILMNPERYPNLNHQLAREFLNFILANTQLIIDYKIGNENLFLPIDD